MVIAEHLIKHGALCDYTVIAPEAGLGQELCLGNRCKQDATRILTLSQWFSVGSGIASQETSGNSWSLLWLSALGRGLEVGSCWHPVHRGQGRR